MTAVIKFQTALLVPVLASIAVSATVTVATADPDPADPGPADPGPAAPGDPAGGVHQPPATVTITITATATVAPPPLPSYTAPLPPYPGSNGGLGVAGGSAPTTTHAPLSDPIPVSVLPPAPAPR